MVAVENTPAIHNLVVCTLCSCYPWPVLGLPPVWYKSRAYRSRAVIDPRGVLAEFGSARPADVEVRVWDSTAEVRYLVLPERPAGTEALGRRGARRAGHPRRDDRDAARPMNGVHDMGGMHGLGPVAPEAGRAGVPRAVGGAHPRPHRLGRRRATSTPGAISAS